MSIRVQLIPSYDKSLKGKYFTINRKTIASAEVLVQARLSKVPFEGTALVKPKLVSIKLRDGNESKTIACYGLTIDRVFEYFVNV